jgi:phosphoribosyl 1,2-cyclic phosphodiesterase/CheY-like chemotaxis protein
VRVEFWGTRGSIATPGSSTVRYGGNTSCVEVRSRRGTLVVLDCGTGAHPLGQKLISGPGKSLRGHILISHTHWDHIQGIPFFAPLFVPGNEWDIYGPRGLDQSLRETLAGQMQYAYFPVSTDQFGAAIRYHDLVEGIFDVDDIKISTRYLNHPALTLGYRLEADGATIVYCCDHEPHSRTLANGKGEFAGQDLRHAEFVHGADLLIHDAQYTAAEYVAKVGWGHSSIEYAVGLSQYAKVKRLALTHHDPLRDDSSLDHIVDGINLQLHNAGSVLKVSAAAEGEIIDIEPSQVGTSQRSAGHFQAMISPEPALDDRSIILNIADSKMAAALCDAVRAEGMPPKFFTSIEEARELIAKDRPVLAILEHEVPRIDGIKICRAIREIEEDPAHRLSVVMISSKQNSPTGAVAGVTEWLIKPFTSSYARTKIRAWALRTACRWMRAIIPDDEERRITSLRELGILDTEPEERFDRVTRVAAALFGVPMALISLVDEDRQWFKSGVGVRTKETSRDASFCAHVVYSKTPMIVADTFQDDRFADNPLVINEPRIRFYAGHPLILDDGSCIGTLCLLDTRPRSLGEFDLKRLHDLADIALQQLAEPRHTETTGGRTRVCNVAGTRPQRGSSSLTPRRR